MILQGILPTIMHEVNKEMTCIPVGLQTKVYGGILKCNCYREQLRFCQGG